MRTYIHHTRTQQVINGRVQTVYNYNWPADYTCEQKQIWLLNHGTTERQAYMIAFNVSETEMQRIEND